MFLSFSVLLTCFCFVSLHYFFPFFLIQRGGGDCIQPPLLHPFGFANKMNMVVVNLHIMIAF